jgi:5-methylcytosine-specific restriction endonuclease McrA
VSVPRLCAGCLKRFRPAGRENRCPECLAELPTRAELEPWRSLYKRGAWLNARARVLARDGRRCRGAWNGERCSETRRLEVHHRRPLRDLWLEAAGEYGRFVELGCDERNLVTLCRRCHEAAEKARAPL